MKPISHKRFSILLNNELFWSEAFQSLTKSAQKLLMAMVAELKYTGKRGSKKHPFCYTNNGKIFGDATFIIKLSEYDVKIPKLLRENIAEKVEVNIQLELNKK